MRRSFPPLSFFLFKSCPLNSAMRLNKSPSWSWTVNSEHRKLWHLLSFGRAQKSLALFYETWNWIKTFSSFAKDRLFRLLVFDEGVKRAIFLLYDQSCHVGGPSCHPSLSTWRHHGMSHLQHYSLPQHILISPDCTTYSLEITSVLF